MRLSDGQRHAVTTAVAVLGLVDEQDRSRARTRRHLRARAMELLIGNDAETAQLVLDVDLPTSVLPPRLRVLRATKKESEVDDVLTGLGHRGILAGTLSGELCAVLELRRALGVGAALADDGAAGYRTAGLAFDRPPQRRARCSGTASSAMARWV